MEEKSLPAVGQKAGGNSPSATNSATVKPPRRFRLSKSEILRGYNAFTEVIRQERYFQVSNVGCFYSIRYDIPPGECQVGFAVRRQRKAVVRNKLRRYTREAYRLNKQIILDFCEHNGFSLKCVIITSHHGEDKRQSTFQHYNTCLLKVLERLIERISRSGEFSLPQ